MVNKNEIIGGKCGCVFCKTGTIGPNTRSGWAGVGLSGKHKRKSGK